MIQDHMLIADRHRKSSDHSTKQSNGRMEDDDRLVHLYSFSNSFPIDDIMFSHIQISTCHKIKQENQQYPVLITSNSPVPMTYIHAEIDTKQTAAQLIMNKLKLCLQGLRTISNHV